MKMSLFNDPLQLLIVGAIVVVFIMWGPKKIPELAKALGQARGEFAAAAAEKPVGAGGLATNISAVPSPPLLPSVHAQQAGTAVEPSITTPAALGVVGTPIASSSAAADDQLIETAEKLGIPTKGKTPSEISDAIVAKVKGLSY
jgi:hypothetical protein